MIIQSAGHTSISQGVLSENAFSFEANAIAAFTLMSGIAKNKIAYPIRELCTNAWDVAGGDFDVKLPSIWEPTFCVRDYGPGLSDVEMRETYTRFFASTKRDTNDQVGGLGLGCKSPFAYLIRTDASGSQAASYMVRSFQEGQVRTYTMSLSEGGMPIMRLLDDSPTDERNGLEVSFSVRREDIQAFQDEARLILWSFEPRPRTRIMFEIPQIVTSKDTWTSYVSSSVPWSGPHVRMGCVMYPVDLSQLGLTQFISQSDTVLFEARIGSLTVQTSRESLGYDDRTKATLEALIETYETERVREIEDKVAEAKTVFSADKAFIEITRGLRHSLVERLRRSVLWNGKPIPDRVHSPHMFLRKGWEPFDRFDKFTACLPDIPDDVTVVIEHNPNRSFDRFRAAGLVGKPVLWIRCKGYARDIILDSFHLSEDEVVILDQVKIDQPTRDKTLIRVRQMTIGWQDDVPAHPYVRIDPTGGHLFIRKEGRGRWTNQYTLKEGFTLNQSSFETLLSRIRAVGLCQHDTLDVIVVGPNDDVPEDWYYLGDYLELRLKDLFDPDKISSIDPNVSTYSLPTHIRLVGYKDIHSPELIPDIGDVILQSAKVIQDHGYGAARRGSDAHQERILETLRLLRADDIPAIQRSDYTDLDNKVLRVIQKYPLLTYILRQCSTYMGELEKRRVKKHLIHYSELLKAHDSLQHL